MAVRIVTDSACDLPPELEAELHDWGVLTIPFVFHFGQEACEDKSMSMETFLARAKEVWPTTAAPSPGAYARCYEQIVSAGDQALCLVLTARHSGAYNTAVMAAQPYSADQVAVIDTRTFSLGEGFLALAAVRAARAGATLHEVAALVREMLQRIRFAIGLDTLDYVVRGGRASRMVGLVASLLQMRPILSMDDGALALREKPRSRSRRMERLIAMVESYLPLEALGVLHAACAEEAEVLADALARLTGWARSSIPVLEVGMALATHSGPGALGVACVLEPRPEDRERRLRILGHEMPQIELPHIELPHIEVPRVNLPRLGRDDKDESQH